jgi:hypothetical protein
MYVYTEEYTDAAAAFMAFSGHLPLRCLSTPMGMTFKLRASYKKI